MQNNQVQKNIMRRVYYAFALRLATHGIVVHGVLFGAALNVFARMVHVARVVEAVQTLPIAYLPQYVLNAVAQGEVVTLLALGVMLYACTCIGTNLGRLVSALIKIQQYALR